MLDKLKLMVVMEEIRLLARNSTEEEVIEHKTMLEVKMPEGILLFVT